MNGPLSNMPAFAEAFGCKPGDPMVRARNVVPNILVKRALARAEGNRESAAGAALGNGREPDFPPVPFSLRRSRFPERALPQPASSLALT